MLRLDTQLAAPTGRAAKRMSELTGRSAQTIHRLLEAGMSDDHQDITFRRDEDDQLERDAVILDECSMVDISLMCAAARHAPGMPAHPRGRCRPASVRRTGQRLF